MIWQVFTAYCQYDATGPRPRIYDIHETHICCFHIFFPLGWAETCTLSPHKEVGGVWCS